MAGRVLFCPCTKSAATIHYDTAEEDSIKTAVHQGLFSLFKEPARRCHRRGSLTSVAVIRQWTSYELWLPLGTSLSDEVMLYSLSFHPCTQVAM